jgi:serine/threonine protein kinase
MAPEVISGISYSFPADLWSVGITAVELAEGAPPYAELPPPKAMIEIATKGFPGYRFPTKHSAEFCDFVSHCVAQDPKQRWTIPELMEHPFIQREARLVRANVLAEMLLVGGERRVESSGPSTFSFEGDPIPAEIASATPMETRDASSPISFGSDLIPSADEFALFRPGDDDLKPRKTPTIENARPYLIPTRKKVSSQNELISTRPPGSESSNSGTDLGGSGDFTKDGSGGYRGQGANSLMSPRKPRFSSQPFSNPELQPVANAKTAGSNDVRSCRYMIDFLGVDISPFIDLLWGLVRERQRRG